MVHFKGVVILGLGLIGGSLGMAIRRKRLAREVVGWSRRASTLAQALHRGAITRGARSVEEAVRDADLVILATPVDQIITLGRHAARAMRAGAILTDVGSTKGAIVRALECVAGDGVRFIGAHPLAGSEQRGVAAAHPSLFDGSVCIVTRTPRTSTEGLARVAALWQAVAGRVVVMDPAAHDRLLARVSHLPHVLAFSLVEAAGRRDLAMAPRSFLDMTRVANSDPALWDDILLSNAGELLASMRRFERTWNAAKRLVRRGDRRGLAQWLRHAHRLRQTLRDR